jgi:hypothetical protein
MTTILSILNGSGDTKVTWDHDNPEEVAQARQTVADLAALGYVFFLTDGTPADAVTAAGGGALIARKLAPDEVVAAVAETTLPADSPETPERPKRRGRPPKVRPETNVVAARPLRGG